MPLITEDELPQSNETRDNEVPPVTAPMLSKGTVIDNEVAPVPIEPPKPVVDDQKGFRTNLDDIQLSPTYFDNLGRVLDTGVVDETTRTGVDQLNGMDATAKAQLYQSELLQNQSQPFKEIAGVAEMLAKGAINMFGDGFTSAAALWKSFENAPGFIIDDNGLHFAMDLAPSKTFAEDYISTQGQIAAATGRFYDYTPLLETTSRDQEAVGQFLNNTVGAAGNYLGESTLELTGSPELAAAAKLAPDAILMSLPLLPKGIRAIRNTARANEYLSQVAEESKNAIQRQGYHLDIRDMESSAENGYIPKGSFSMSVIEPSSGARRAGLDAIVRGDELQVTNLFADKGIQGRSIGPTLIKTVVDQAATRGLKAIVSDTVVSEQAAGTLELMARRAGARLEKNPTATLEDYSNVTAETVSGDKYAITGKAWESGNGRPVYRLVLDEPAATSTLTPTKMKLETLRGMRGEAPPPDPALVAQIATDLAAGKAVGDIIVETVEGSPTRILSGADTLEAMAATAEKNGLKLKNITVKLQERVNPTAEETVNLERAADAGARDIFANEAKLEAARKTSVRSLGERLKHLFIDSSGNVKAQIIKAYGEEGYDAIRDFSLKAGAVPKAHLMFQDFHRSVFGARGPLDPGIGTAKTFNYRNLGMQSERDLFNTLVQSRRTQAIMQSGGALVKSGKFQLAGAVRPENAAGNIAGIRAAVGEVRFAQLQARADSVFDTMHKQLVRLRENGIISEGSFRRMQNINYITREFLEEIDPIVDSARLKNVKVSIGESGIHHLKGGTTRAQNIDVQSLVAEYLARTEGRIFRNNANKTLYRLAQQKHDEFVASGLDPKYEQNFVKLPKSATQKIPEGYDELKLLIDGETRRLFMRSVYAQEWVINDPGLSLQIANIFSVMNGNFVIKPLATGINPAFAFVNFPRDVMHAWRATGNEYSAFLPRYIGQITSDISEVMKDAWYKKGAYRDYIDEGGGMNFLAHGGFDLATGFTKEKDLLRAVGVPTSDISRQWTNIKESLSKVNEMSEIVVRLAIRNRVLKNQMARGELPNGAQATFIARDYLDFAQGGTATKAIESFIPYTNAATQAIRTAFRGYTRGWRDARVLALKDMQILGTKAVVSGWAWMEHPEVMAQVDPHQQFNNQVFPTGLSFVDEHGDRRHLTVNIAMDTTIVPFTAPFDLAISKHALLATGLDPNYIPDRHTLGEIASTLPILGSVQTGSPLFQAAVALLANKDIWANRDIWTGDPYVQPGSRRSEGTEGTIFDALGTAFPKVVSPVQLQKAWRTFVPSNFYIDSADWIRQRIQQSLDPVKTAEQEQRNVDDYTLEALANIPGLSRVIHLTHPAAQTTPELRALAVEVATWREMESQAVDKAVREYRALGKSDQFTDLLNRVAAARPQDAEKVKDMLITQIAVGEMFRQNKYDIGFVGQNWFNNLAGQNAETRADLFYWKWVTLSDQNARNLEAVLGSIDKVAGRRIRTDQFETQLKKNIATYGTREQRRSAISAQH